MAQMYPKVYYQDKILRSNEATLSVASSAVLYGLSVYTVFPVSVDKNGRKLAFRLEDHFKRLMNSAKIIGIDTFEKEWNYARFEKSVVELVAVNEVSKDVFVRATVHVVSEIAGTRSRGLDTVLSMFIYDAVPILNPKGARVKTSVWRRVPDYAIPSRAKVNGSYVNSVLAKQEAIDSGYDDCVFLDSHGHVCELSAANIFIVRHGKLITPDLTTDLLEGINRQTVIELANELGLEVVERSVDLTELYVAEEVFACGTSANIAPIIEVDARMIADGKAGPITSMLQKTHIDIRLKDSNKKWLTLVS